ncbi:MAG TPA: hypothetical protein VMI34_21690 [Candidatus Bathyarchaeia archaeon]|nr:hypothetical protein [Candidatus Bathyarchaeia archaeon]
MPVLRKLWLVALLGAACAGVAMTPEQKVAHEIFVEVAYRCESRFHTIHVDTVDPEGGLQIHSDADSRTEFRPFVACYQDGLKARVESMRKAGQAVPEALTREPDVVLD